ncbi:MAG: hypothetical protein IPM04_18505 [Saprospiraceae bacterium]|nr:hypothetical protein [Candidatus Brachybacter algidus]
MGVKVVKKGRRESFVLKTTFKKDRRKILMQIGCVAFYIFGKIKSPHVL